MSLLSLLDESLKLVSIKRKPKINLPLWHLQLSLYLFKLVAGMQGGPT